MKRFLILFLILFNAHSYAGNTLSGGISQFMIDRLQNSFEYSMIVSFLGNMKEEMENSEELRALLPETYYTLTRHIALSDPTHLDFSLFSLLKANIHNDIINIVPNSIIYLLDSENMEQVVMVVEEMEKVIKRLNQLVRKIKQNEIHNIDAILSNIKTIVEDMKKIKELNEVKEPNEEQRRERLSALLDWKK